MRRIRRKQLKIEFNYKFGFDPKLWPFSFRTYKRIAMNPDRQGAPLPCKEQSK